MRRLGRHTAKVLAIFKPITCCHTIQWTAGSPARVKILNFPKASKGTTKCRSQNSGDVIMYTLSWSILAFKPINLCMCNFWSQEVHRGKPVTKLTSFQAHVSLKHLCLAKFRPWPTGLTWQEKHKPEDKLCAKTRAQICSFKFTWSFIYTWHVWHVCTGTHEIGRCIWKLMMSCIPSGFILIHLTALQRIKFSFSN